MSSAMYHRCGLGAPCPSWAFGAVVGPGPAWVRSGFALQNVVKNAKGKQIEVLGKVELPSETVLREWADYIVMALQSGLDAFGGWAPYRSVVVTWGKAALGHRSETFYYKAGDVGEYDLEFWPKQWPMSCYASQSLQSLMQATFDHWEELVVKTAAAAVQQADSKEGDIFMAKVRTHVRQERDHMEGQIRDGKEMVAVQKAMRPHPSDAEAVKFPATMEIGRSLEAEEDSPLEEISDVSSDSAKKTSVSKKVGVQQEADSKEGSLKRQRSHTSMAEHF